MRLNQHGTVELRSIDGNYPEVILAIADLAHDAASRVRAKGLTVEPDSRPHGFKVKDCRLLVPGFEYLGKALSYAAATKGVKNPAVSAYLDSIVEFAAPKELRSEYLTRLRSPEGFYETTEAAILQENSLATYLPLDEGLRSPGTQSLRRARGASFVPPPKGTGETMTRNGEGLSRRELRPVGRSRPKTRLL